MNGWKYEDDNVLFGLCGHIFATLLTDVVVGSSDWFLGYFVGNTFWIIAIGYYIYITFLGYNGE